MKKVYIPHTNDVFASVKTWIVEKYVGFETVRTWDQYVGPLRKQATGSRGEKRSFNGRDALVRAFLDLCAASTLHRLCLD